MKAKAILLIIGFFKFFQLYSQQVDNKGIIKVYANYNHGIYESKEQAAFELERVYLGYKARLDDRFKAEVKVDIGSPDDVSPYSRLRRYAYFKTAALFYSYKNLNLSLGLIGSTQIDLVEDFWQNRYIRRSFQDEFGFGPSADIGLAADYTFTEKVSADFSITNGEGYRNPQRDNNFKYALGISLFPSSWLTLRAYADVLIKDEVPEQSYSLFAGFEPYKGNSTGIEYNVKHNEDFIRFHHLEGYSIYTNQQLTEKTKLFLRYDYLYSNIIEGLPWNLTDDGSSILGGIEYSPISNIHFSLNYQDWFSRAANLANQQFIFINLEFKY